MGEILRHHPKSCGHSRFAAADVDAGAPLAPGEKIGSSTVAPCEPIMRAKPHPEQGFRSCRPASRQSVSAKKNETPNCKYKTLATPSLIRWSIQEVRRIAIRLARKRIQPAHIIAWSLWRRAHQAVAQRAHFKAKRQL
jgi:hypothetical protein